MSEKFSGQELTDIALWLAEETTGLSRTALIVGKDTTNFSYSQIDAYIDRILAGEPLAYVLGTTDWRGLRLRVNRHTLIPRPETSELADIVLSDNGDSCRHVIDWCTGSGCIALALKQRRPYWDITGFDIDSEAVTTARENAKLNSLEVEFEQADIFMQTENSNADIIVCNPPYIMESEREQMEHSVLDFEPPGALFVSDTDPLLFYRTIAKHHAAPLLYFEINPLCCNDLVNMLARYGYKAEVMTDFAGKQRFIKCREIDKNKNL